MKRNTLLIASFFSAFVCGQAQQSVVLEERTLVIPTYQVAPPDVNPFFYAGRAYQGAQGHVYPYPMYDVLTDNRTNQNYKAVYLENEYTELCVMPELGGRILSALDKASQYDFFYHQHVVKPALIGMIGAWMSGGVEWNIPHHHRASSQLPVDYRLVFNPDSSKTVWVGETELRHRLKWEVGLTLYPGKSYIEATVRVFNNTPYIHSFLYWANVSVHCNENYQVIFPPKTQYGTQHAKTEFVDWPVGRGFYGGKDRNETDLSWFRNHPMPASIFAWNFDDDFLAGYDYGKDAGTVHVANHHVVGGKKFFLWGQNKEADMWDKMLTETDGSYLELMVGAFSDNQPDYSWIAPGETKEFKQYWYPASKIGGVKEANTQGAVNLERPSASEVVFGFQPTSLIPNARVKVLGAGKILFERSADMNPKTPFIQRLSVPAALKDEDITLAVYDGQGNEIISYVKEVVEQEDRPEEVRSPGAPSSYNSVEELYLTGLRIEQFHNATLDPMNYYREALRRDSLDSRVNTVVGIRLAKEGRFDEAKQYLNRAIKRVTKDYTSAKDVEALYYLGVILQQEGQLKEAKDCLWKSTWNKGFQSAAYFSLAQIAAREKDYTGALLLIDQSLETNLRNAKAYAIKSYCLRKGGKNNEAAKVAEAGVLVDPLEFFVQSEAAFANQQTPHYAGMGNTAQNLLELSTFYAAMGAFDEAITVLNPLLEESNPLPYYYVAYYKQLRGDSDLTNTYQKAASMNSDLCFPFRTEEMAILKSAIQQNPTDAKARYYLGNLLYFLNQQEAGVEAWREAVSVDPSLAVAHRNLGFAENRKGDPAQAILCYDKAIEANKNDARYFYESDLLKEQLRYPAAKRLAVMEKNKKTILKRDDATSRMISLYIQTGEYDKALKLLTERHFHVWEGGGDIHSIFVDAALLRGLDRMERKKYSEAASDFELACSYPENLEVGEPARGGRLPQSYFFLGEAYRALNNLSKADSCYKKALTYYESSSRRNSSLNYYYGMSMLRLSQTDAANHLFKGMVEASEKELSDSPNMNFFEKFGEQQSRERKNAESYYKQALAYIALGRIPEAKQALEKVVSLNPSHIWAVYYLNNL